MKTLFLFTILTLFTVISTPLQAQNIFEVDSITDGSDINPGDGTCLSINGVCSLRAAIEEANDLPNGALPDKIHFSNIPVSGGTASIEVINLGLPRITEAVTIDGTTAAGEVILDGINNTTDPWLLPTGLELAAGSDGSKVRGLSVINFGRNGIHVSSDDNVIIDNYVGTTRTGGAFSNDQYAVYVSGDNNIIGKPGLGNIVAANESHGIYIHTGSNNKIQSNHLGTNTAGADLGNDGIGIFVSDGSNNIVGGPTTAHGNIVGFNQSKGIYIAGATATIVRNNYLGTDSSFRNLGNLQSGIDLYESTGTIIGGDKNFSNVIGFNDEGIVIRFNSENTVIRGNYIGTNAAGDNLGNLSAGILAYGTDVSGSKIGYRKNATIPFDTPRGNVIAYNGGSGVVIDSEFVPANSPVQHTIRGNLIYENAGSGIDLGDDGLTANDTDDADEGANTYLNHPDVDRAFYRGGNHAIIVEYEISSDSSIVTYPLTVDVYLADDDISGEGKTYIGSDIYTTQNQAVQFEVSADSITWASTDYVVLTATDAAGNTSEFSPPVGELGGPGSMAFHASIPGTDTIYRVQNSTSNATMDAYPNPFNPQTTITLALPETQHIRISVHDILGRQVALLHDANLAAGTTHTFTFDGSDLASGAYLLRVAGDDFMESRRITLLK